MGKTIIQKIIEAHSDRVPEPGDIVWMNLDVRSARDFAGANVVQNYRREYGSSPVENPEKTFFTFDCNVPANTIPYANNQHICRLFAREHGIRVFDVNEGIGSHVMIDQGLCVPGDTVVGTDSHLNILGGIGVLGLGMGDQDITFAFKTGKTWFEVPETTKIIYKGMPSAWAGAKDVILFTLSSLGTGRVLGKAVEFEGEYIEKLSLDARITLSSMVTELSGIVGFPLINDDVLEYCSSRTPKMNVPKITADADADYSEIIEIDIEALPPMAAAPFKPVNGRPVHEYENVNVDSVFIGSCTNGRLEDLETAAQILNGKTVATNVMLRIVPATREIYGKMLEKGLINIFFDAGAVISNPGCGGCASGQIGMTGKNEVQISTSNRNFAGKQGDGETYLAGPAVAAASALAGFLISPEQL